MALRILTITLNPAFDLVGETESLQIGRVNSIDTLGFYTAGKGINVAKVLSDLGSDISVTGFLGASNDQSFVKFFNDNGIEDRFIRVEGDTRINIKISSDNQTSDFNFKGFSVSDQNWNDFYNYCLNLQDQFDIVVVAGSLPKGVDVTKFQVLLERLKEQGLKVILDTSGEALKVGIKANPFLVKPNEHELEDLVGEKLTTEQDIIKAAKQLQKKGVENVIVSMGEQGSLGIFGTDIFKAKVPAQKVVSTVGAGDSMVAGFVYGLSKGFDYSQTLTLASSLGALAVTQSDVGVHDKERLEILKKQIEVIKY